MSSNVILSVLEASEDAPEKDLFQKLGVVPEIAQKIKESCANEKPNIARPARQARDLLDSRN